MKILEYKVLYGDTISQLIEETNLLIQEGRQPIGGISGVTEVYTNRDQEVCSTEAYMQSMVIYE